MTFDNPRMGTVPSVIQLIASSEPRIGGHLIPGRVGREPAWRGGWPRCNPALTAPDECSYQVFIAAVSLAVAPTSRGMVLFPGVKPTRAQAPWQHPCRCSGK